jgi:tyrosyl-tRNA synthetase
MSKSLHNQIGIAEPPREIYGKAMSIPDSLIVDYLELLTDIPEEDIAEFKEQLKTRSLNPMSLKKRLAHEIVRQFHGKQAADDAEEHFTQVFQNREIPQEMPTCAFAGEYVGDDLFQVDIAPTLLKEGFIKSTGELKRLLAQQAIELDGNKISCSVINAHRGSILKIGKRRFVRIDVTGTNSNPRSEVS